MEQRLLSVGKLIEDILVFERIDNIDYILDTKYDERVIYCIMNDLPLNAIVFSLNEDINNCVHKQKHISSILKYYNNEFLYEGKFFNELDDINKKTFFRYNFQIINIKDCTPGMLYGLINI